jgi:hypothetical protein
VYGIADGGYCGPDLAELVPEILHAYRATHPHRNADDNGIHVLAAPF